MLAVYLCTLAPTVTGEDSGELITAAYFFGVPHPPGYPLWTMLCGAWTHVVPLGSIAWRANLFSAVCMAGAVVLLSLTLRRMGFKFLVAGTAASACGLTTAVWSQSVITEVYTLNLLLMALLFWLVTRWYCDGRRRWLVWGALVFGLGMANHHILGFAALGLSLWAVMRCPALLRDWRLVSKCLVLFVVGCLPYLYLLWAAQRDVPVKWGETTTLSAVWEHASRGQYKSDNPIEAQIPLTAGLLAAKFYYGVTWEVRQFTPILMPLLAAGMVWLWRGRGRRLWRKGRTLFWWTILLGLCCGPLYLYVGGPRMDRQDYFVQKVFLTPLALVSAVPLAAGLQWLLVSLRTIRERRSASLARRLGWAACLAVIAVPLISHWRENNMRHYYYAEDHARNLLACTLPNAMIFPAGDHSTFPLIYLVHVEKVRPDVVIADKYGYIEPRLYADMPDNPGKPRTREERDAIEEWLIRHSRRPVYYTVKKTPLVDNAKTVTVGLTYHLLPEGKEIDVASCWDRIRYRNLEGLTAPEDHAATNILADYHYARGTRALEAGDKVRAKSEFETCLRHAWGLKEIYNNVASALAEAELLDEAIGHYEEACRMDWRYAPGRWNLARVFKSVGKFDWAAKIFEDLTKATPGDFRPYGELGFLYRNKLGDIERARYWWHESLRINPRQSQIIAALAQSDGAIGTDEEDANTLPPVNTGESNTVSQSHSSEPAATTQPASQPVDGPVAGRLELAETDVDLGTVVEGIPAEHALVFKNAGSGPLTLGEIKSSCSCVVSELQHKSFEPGESGTVTVTLKTAGKAGVVTESLSIQSDDPVNPSQTITLRAIVLPEVSASPAEVLQEVLPSERPASFEVAITNNLGEPFEVTKVTCALPAIHFDWTKGAPAVTHIVHATSTAPLAEAFTGAIEIQTTLPQHAIVQVPLKIAILMPAEVKPSLLYLGRITRDEQVRRAVAIKSVRPGLALDLQFVEGEPIAGLEVHLHKIDESGTSWELEVIVDGTKAVPGTMMHKVLIAIGGCDKMIEVSIHGNVAD